MCHMRLVAVLLAPSLAARVALVPPRRGAAALVTTRRGAAPVFFFPLALAAPRLAASGGKSLPGPVVPVPEPYSQYEEDALLDGLKALLTQYDGTPTRTYVSLKAALSQVCNPLFTPKNPERAEFWKPYRDQDNGIVEFFAKWVKYSPEPEGLGPSYYIEKWDWLANTEEGLTLTSDNVRFREWFVKFLDVHGRWINSEGSATTIPQWMTYSGTAQHPFNINDFIVPEGGFKTFNQFFLRNIKESVRPLDKTACVVSPCDGGAFYLQKEGGKSHLSHVLPHKSNDRFNLAEALPGYGNAFIGGPLFDTLLWFTDYHSFHSPVDGVVLSVASYKGSYNYDFDDYDYKDPYAPKPPDTSDRVAWYEKLNKHKRLAWIIKTEDMGLVAMVAIGFWGVGSITSEVRPGQQLKRGDYMGHFGYGGSSILLAFEPKQDILFDQKLGDADHPYLVKVRQGFGHKKQN